MKIHVFQHHVDQTPRVRLLIHDQSVHVFQTTMAALLIVGPSAQPTPNVPQVWLALMRNVGILALVLADGTQNVVLYPTHLNAIVQVDMKEIHTTDATRLYLVRMIIYILTTNHRSLKPYPTALRT